MTTTQCAEMLDCNTRCAAPAMVGSRYCQPHFEERRARQEAAEPSPPQKTGQASFSGIGKEKVEVYCPCGVVFKSIVGHTAPKDNHGKPQAWCPACLAERSCGYLYDKWQVAQAKANRLRRRYPKPELKL